MAFQQGLSGLNASSKALDVTGNNISNASTVGFKAAVAHFGDIYAASLQDIGLGQSQQIGIGTTLSAAAQQFTQGNITSTSNPLDIAINGNGFFGLDNNGALSYTRNGQFHVDSQGYIVNDQGNKLRGVMADATGTIPLQPPTDDMMVQFVTGTPQATTGTTITANLNSSNTVPTVSPFDATNTKTYNSSTAQTVYDSLGNSHTLSYYFAKTAANTWDVYTGLDGTVGAAPTTLTFSSAGALQTPSPATISESFALTNGATTPMAFSIDVSKLTQYGTAFSVNDLTQDGFAPGNLSSVSVSKDGILQARYDNGQTRDIGQIALFNFTNPNGLGSIGNNQWIETTESGGPSAGTPNSGVFGQLQSASVEESNVDLTAELVNLIVQQRNYQANAQSIKAQDQIMQTMVNLR